jgi:putative SOS response-associated peptidase YedK
MTAAILLLMCGRISIKTDLDSMLSAFAFAKRTADVEAMANAFPRWNGAPSLEYPIIVMDVVRDATEPIFGPVFTRAKWGFVPSWMKEQKPGRPPPINARAETVATNGLFRHAYAGKRCLVPIDGYFEWKDIFDTGKNKQPYAIAMNDGSPFCLAGIWSERRDPETGLEQRTFCILTCEPNEMMAEIHDRMPVILHREDYDRWLSSEPGPHDLLKPFPADLMTMWPIDRKVGSPRNNTPDILDPIDLE